MAYSVRSIHQKNCGESIIPGLALTAAVCAARRANEYAADLMRTHPSRFGLLPDLAPGVNGTTGLGDVQESLFLSPAKAGPVIWGAGPAISFPTATQSILGTKKLSIGPNVVVLRSQGHWLFGSLVQNLFSVAGPSSRPDVSQMLLQPFVNYNLRHGWYLTSSPIITANWEAKPDQRWTVPVGGGFGRIIRVGKQPVNVYTQFFGNAKRPDGTTSWSVRFDMQFLFPKKR